MYHPVIGSFGVSVHRRVKRGNNTQYTSLQSAVKEHNESIFELLGVILNDVLVGRFFSKTHTLLVIHTDVILCDVKMNFVSSQMEVLRAG